MTLLTGYAAFIWRTSWESGGVRRFTLFDDAMVSMAYARTLVEGGGWGWYPGAEPVEGYSNPLWMLIMAGAHLLPGGDRLAPLHVMVVGAAVLIGCVAVATRLARLLGAGGPAVAAMSGLLVGLSYPLVFWTLRGMEVGLVALEALVLVWALLAWDDDRRVRSALLVAGVAFLGVLTRLDVGVLAGAAGLWVLVLGGRTRWVRLAALVAGVGSSVVVQTVFRLVVFGEVAPNTYTLKLGGAELTDRLYRGGWAVGLFLLTGGLMLVALGALASAWSDRTRRRELLLPLLMAGAMAGYAVWIGGDVWEESAIASRFLAVVLPLLAVPAIVAVSLATRTWGRRAFVAAGTVVVTGGGGVLGAQLLRSHLTDLGVDPATLDTQLRWSLVVSAVGGAVLLAGALATTRLRRPAIAGVLVVGAVCLFANSLGLRLWMDTSGGHMVHGDELATEFGLMLGDITEPGARVAVVWAGAPVYWSRRDGIDLLGKADPVVAAGEPHTEYGFRPGHMKWDIPYSVGELRPDLIAQLWLPDEAQDFTFPELGYVLVRPTDADRDFFAEGAQVLGPPGLWALEGSPAIRWDRVKVVP